MSKKMLVAISFIFLLLHIKYANAEDFKYIEIFDPKQDKVVRVVQSNPEIQNTIGSWIKNMQGIYGKNNPFTDDGYAIKVPLDPAVKVQSQSLRSIVNQVYIIIPKIEPPFYIIFEDENKAVCYPFNGDIDVLSNILDFKLSYKFNFTLSYDSTI